jgi:hypothetical protein
MTVKPTLSVPDERGRHRVAAVDTGQIQRLRRPLPAGRESCVLLDAARPSGAVHGQDGGGHSATRLAAGTLRALWRRTVNTVKSNRKPPGELA